MPYKDLEKRTQYMAAYRARNRALLSQRERERDARLKAENLEQWRARKKRYRANANQRQSPEERKAKQRAYALAHYHKKKADPEFRAKNVAKAREWAQVNKAKARQAFNAIRRRRKAQDLNYRLAESLRRRLYMAVRNGGATQGEAVRQLGCSVAELKAYLATKFSSDMTWENWGTHGWHIDHIKPLRSFNLEDPEQVRIACHYSNLQPLWAAENIRKGANDA